MSYIDRRIDSYFSKIEEIESIHEDIFCAPIEVFQKHSRLCQILSELITIKRRYNI